MKRGKSKTTPRQSLPDFAALRNFLSGYLHQDFRDEYDSPAAAAAAFCADSSPDEIAAVRSEWTKWRKQLGDASPGKMARAIRELGGAWAPETRDDLDSVENALQSSESPNPRL